MSIEPTCSVEFTTGKREKDKVIYDGQRYTLNRRRHGKDGVEIGEVLLDLLC